MVGLSHSRIQGYKQAGKEVNESHKSGHVTYLNHQRAFMYKEVEKHYKKWQWFFISLTQLKEILGPIVFSELPSCSVLSPQSTQKQLPS